MSSDDAWSTPSNDALLLSLVSPSPAGLRTVGHSFHPKFTYPIFGESEEIFGYQNLEISLRYNASDMRPNLSVTYSKKFPTVGETEATDIEGILREFLPEVAFQKKSEFETAVKDLRDDWSPPGEVIAAFTAHGDNYEVWKASLADPAVRQLVRRIQILVPLFIEGGSAIDVDDADADRWTVFFLYQKQPAASESGHPTHFFAGYCTVYRFFHFQPPPTPPQSPSEADLEKHTLEQNFDLSLLPCRTRISQFIIIPPFQQKGLGPRLYSTIYEEYIKHPQTVEITVEDPNEAFDDLRDVADLQYLRRQPYFQALRINTALAIPKTGPAPANIVDRAAYDAARAKAKMAPRQFARVLEMHLMSQLPESVRPGIAAPEEEEVEEEGRAEEGSFGKGKQKQKQQQRQRPAPSPAEQHEYRLWRLMLKKRIYKHNKDALGELELTERIAKLDETVSSVEFDYARLLIRAEEQGRALAAAAASAAAPAPGKRKAVNGDEGSEADHREEESARKKARVEAP